VHTHTHTYVQCVYKSALHTSAYTSVFCIHSRHSPMSKEDTDQRRRVSIAFEHQVHPDVHIPATNSSNVVRALHVGSRWWWGIELKVDMSCTPDTHTNKQKGFFSPPLFLVRCGSSELHPHRWWWNRQKHDPLVITSDFSHLPVANGSRPLSHGEMITAPAVRSLPDQSVRLAKLQLVLLDVRFNRIKVLLAEKHKKKGREEKKRKPGGTENSSS